MNEIDIKNLESELLEYRKEMDKWWIINQENLTDPNILLEYRSMIKKETELLDKLEKALGSTNSDTLTSKSFKLAESLDNIANILESKGLVKEAYEIDKIADYVEANLLNSLEVFIRPLNEKIDTSGGVTTKIGDEIVTVVKKPNAVFFALENELGNQTAAGYIDLLKDNDLKETINKMTIRDLAKFYLDNIDAI